MLAGNATYSGPEDLPQTVPLFPLTGAVLLPKAQMPLNIFEPRDLAMIDAALRGALQLQSFFLTIRSLDLLHEHGFLRRHVSQRGVRPFDVVVRYVRAGDRHEQ